MEEGVDEILDNSINGNIDSSHDELGPYDKGYELKRITFKGLMGFILSVLNFERGILFTIKELILRPKVVIEEYLKKDRKKLINPIRFLVFSTAIATFLNITLIHSNEDFNSMKVNFNEGLNEGMNEELEELEKQDSTLKYEVKTVEENLDSNEIKNRKLKKEKAMAFFSNIPEKITQWSDKLTFVSMFFYSFFTFLFFRKNGYNFTEHLVINSYQVSISNVFSIFFVLLALLTQSTMVMVVSSLIGFIYNIYYWTSVFNRKSTGGVFRCILTYITSNFTLMIISGIVAVIYVIVAFR